jgi:hypothetical protein
MVGKATGLEDWDADSSPALRAGSSCGYELSHCRSQSTCDAVLSGQHCQAIVVGTEDLRAVGRAGKGDQAYFLPLFQIPNASKHPTCFLIQTRNTRMQFCCFVDGRSPLPMDLNACPVDGPGEAMLSLGLHPQVQPDLGLGHHLLGGDVHLP